MIGPLGALLSMLLVVGAPTSGVAAPAEDESHSVRLIIDIEGLDAETGPRMRKAIEGPIADMLAADGFEITDSATADVTVRVRSLWLNEAAREYEFHIDLAVEGGVKPAIEWFVCKFCPEATAQERILGAFPSALPVIHAAARGEEISPTIECPAPVVNDDPSTEPHVEDHPESPARVPLVGPVGITGLVLTGAGLGVAIAGGVELSRGREAESLGEFDRDFVDHRQAGRVLFATGASVIAVGVIMTAVDIGIRAQKSKSTTKSNAAKSHTAAPVFGHRFLGLTYTGRF